MLFYFPAPTSLSNFFVFLIDASMKKMLIHSFLYFPALTTSLLLTFQSSGLSLYNSIRRLMNSCSVTRSSSMAADEWLTQCLIKVAQDGQASVIELESIKLSINHRQRLIQSSKQLLDGQSCFLQAIASSFWSIRLIV